MIGAQHVDILADESTREALDRGIAKMARSYNETTLQQLKDVIGEKLTQDEGTNLTEGGALPEQAQLALWQRPQPRLGVERQLHIAREVAPVIDIAR
jgi:hypothetical protein